MKKFNKIIIGKKSDLDINLLTNVELPLIINKIIYLNMMGYGGDEEVLNIHVEGIMKVVKRTLAGTKAHFKAIDR